MPPTPDAYVKQGDVQPSLFAVLEDANGNPIDLTGASVALHLKGATVAATVTGTAQTTATTGQVRYDWQAADTATAGYFWGEWQVTYSNGQTETFPNGGNFLVQITSELS